MTCPRSLLSYLTKSERELGCSLAAELAMCWDAESVVLSARKMAVLMVFESETSLGAPSADALELSLAQGMASHLARASELALAKW